MTVKKKFIAAVGVLTILWIAAVLVSVFSGIYDAGIIDTVTGRDELASTIFYKIRIPRVLMATVAGGTFAICGAALQALFRNPLASPFTLGISGGASL
ncbi:MAG: iron chelate uptake ABC transporter family permease subunit, partial [Candidatus Dadabacteria bacterium]